MERFDDVTLYVRSPNPTISSLKDVIGLQRSDTFDEASVVRN